MPNPLERGEFGAECCYADPNVGWSMIRKSVQRFSETIMLNQRPKAR
jgi:hypothetical protein